ncbi:MAG: hypothetical protein V3S16_03525 [Candidatus Desulfatibia sp.]
MNNKIVIPESCIDNYYFKIAYAESCIDNYYFKIAYAEFSE